MLYKSEADLVCSEPMDKLDIAKEGLWSDVAFFKRNISNPQADYERIRFNSQKFKFNAATNSLTITDLRKKTQNVSLIFSLFTFLI